MRRSTKKNENCSYEKGLRKVATIKGREGGDGDGWEKRGSNQRKVKVTIRFDSVFKSLVAVGGLLTKTRKQVQALEQATVGSKK